MQLRKEKLFGNDCDTTNYAIAFIDVEPGDRRINLHIKEEDAELALEVMREMKETIRDNFIKKRRWSLRI